MKVVSNPSRERLESGDVSLGVALRQARTVDVGKIMATCGFDWLFIDMEHNSMSIDTAAQISVAAQDAGITPLVRGPGFEHFHATRALDGGALGVVVPHVDTPEQAARVVANCRYPPAGNRSVTLALPHIDFRGASMVEAIAALNAITMIVVMLETPEAIANLEGIAAVPGIDVLFIGAQDLCVTMGIPGQVDSPKIAEVFEKVIAACRANGKHPGFGGAYDPPLMERYIAMGMRFVLVGSDLALMMAAAQQRTAFLRGLALT